MNKLPTLHVIKYSSTLTSYLRYMLSNTAAHEQVTYATCYQIQQHMNKLRYMLLNTAAHEQVTLHVNKYSSTYSIATHMYLTHVIKPIKNMTPSIVYEY